MMSWLVICFASSDRAAIIEKAVTSFAQIASHLGSKNFMQGDDVTLVDFLMFDSIETIQALCEDDRLLQEYTNLTPYMERMRNLPNFRDYLNSDDQIRSPFFGNPAIKVSF